MMHVGAQTLPENIFVRTATGGFRDVANPVFQRVFGRTQCSCHWAMVMAPLSPKPAIPSRCFQQNMPTSLSQVDASTRYRADRLLKYQKYSFQVSVVFCWRSPTNINMFRLSGFRCGIITRLGRPVLCKSLEHCRF